MNQVTSLVRWKGSASGARGAYQGGKAHGAQLDWSATNKVRTARQSR